jgi:hypothetical protein
MTDPTDVLIILMTAAVKPAMASNGAPTFGSTDHAQQ